MKCNLPSKQSRKEREIEANRQDIGVRMFDFCLLNAILTLGEQGYGEKRLRRFVEQYKAMSMTMLDRYDDYMLDAMRKKVKELYGIEIEIV